MKLRERMGKTLDIKLPSLTGRKPSVVQEVSGRGPSPGNVVRTIRNATEDEVHRKIELLDELMPSTHRQMQVLNATRRDRSGQVEECVVKVRGRPGSFANTTEEQEWRTSTEYIMNLPRSEEIVWIYDVFATPTNYYIVMEKADGRDLFEALATTGGNGLTFGAAREVMRQLLQALVALHSAGGIHKDLKIENVVVDTEPPDGSPARVKVIDFDTVEPLSPDSWKPKHVLGTDGYIAPEAYLGEYSAASDIFATGVIMYKMMTGRFPFRKEIFDDGPGENWVGSPAMARVHNRLRTCSVDFARPPFNRDHVAADLCSRLLAYETRSRPSAEEALAHRWFSIELECPESPTSPKRPTSRAGW